MPIQPSKASMHAAPQVHVVVYLTNAHTRPQQEKGPEQRKHHQQQSDEGHSITVNIWIWKIFGRFGRVTSCSYSLQFSILVRHMTYNTLKIDMKSKEAL